MGFTGMLPALEQTLNQVQKGELHVIEGLDLLLEHEWRHRQNPDPGGSHWYRENLSG